MSTPLERSLIMPAEWGAKVDTTKGWADDSRYKPNCYIVHYGGGANKAGDRPYDTDREMAVLRSWEAWHTSKSRPQGTMRAIAYNYGVGQTGTGYYLRGPKHSNGGQYGVWNSTSRTVVFILGGEQQASGAARRMFGRLWLEEPFTGKVYGHRDVGDTACPGKWLYEWIRRDGWLDDLGEWCEGERGPIVSSLKVRLHRLGYRLTPTYGPLFNRGLTRQVKRFQRRHGLLVDGICGRQTFAALGGLLGEVYPDVHDDPA